ALRLPDEFGAGHLGCFLESLAFRLAAQPGKGGDRLPAPDAPAHATLAVDVHDHVAHLATGSAASPQDAAVVNHAGAEHLACVERDEPCQLPPVPEPQVADGLHPRVVIDHHRHTEDLAELRSDRHAGEARGSIDLEDHTGLSVDHARSCDPGTH